MDRLGTILGPIWVNLKVGERDYKKPCRGIAATTLPGLFRSAQDHVARHSAPGRAALWRRGVANAFAAMLETGG